MSEPYAYWNSLRHGGMLMSQSRLTSVYPPTVDPLPERKTERLRRVLQSTQAAGEGAPLLDAVLVDLCGLAAVQWIAGDDFAIQGGQFFQEFGRRA